MLAQTFRIPYHNTSVMQAPSAPDNLNTGQCTMEDDLKLVLEESEEEEAPIPPAPIFLMPLNEDWYGSHSYHPPPFKTGMGS